MTEPISMATVSTVTEARTAAADGAAGAAHRPETAGRGGEFGNGREGAGTASARGSTEAFLGTLNMDAPAVGKAMLSRAEKSGPALSEALDKSRVLEPIERPFQASEQALKAGPRSPDAHTTGDRLALSEASQRGDSGRVSKVETFPNELDRVPLFNSKGEIQHHVSAQEAAHYKNLGLTAKDVNGREVLIQPGIDWHQKDYVGRTNKERASQGLAPLDETGSPYELHHVQQEPNGMLAELKRTEHTGDGNFTLLYTKQESAVEHGTAWDAARADHWRARAEQAGAA